MTTKLSRREWLAASAGLVGLGALSRAASGFERQAGRRSVHLLPQHQHDLGAEADAGPGGRDRREGRLSGDRALDSRDGPARQGRRLAAPTSARRSRTPGWPSSTPSASSSGPSTTRPAQEGARRGPAEHGDGPGRSAGPGSPRRPSGRPIRPTSTSARSPSAIGPCSRSATAYGVTPIVEVWGFSKPISRLGEAALVAIESGHPRAAILADVYHLHKGGSDFGGLHLLGPDSIPVLHMNDYPTSPARSSPTPTASIPATASPRSRSSSGRSGRSGSG